MRKIYLFLLFLIFCTVAKAQNNATLTKSYRQTYFIEVINDLETAYQTQFFLDPKLDSVKIDFDIVDLNLKETLKQLTIKSNINFLVKDNGRVVIATGEYTISPSLDRAFFDLPKDNIETTVPNQNSVLDNIREITESEKDKRLENQLIEIGQSSKRFEGKLATVVGYIREAKTGEPVIGASVFKRNPTVGVITDQFGYFSLTLPKGKHELLVNFAGMKPLKRQIMLFSDGKLDLEMRNSILSLKEVVVTGERDVVDNLQTGFASLSIKSIKEIPSILGEADIMKIALTLPGVQTVGEGAAGFNVRGGSADQNLVLLNDVPVYNTNHLFGFFSVFNPDVLASANLYKSGIGANYGGRISSVFDVVLRDGNKKKFTYKGGISPITGKVTVEGPIKKDTSSYIVGIRSTYSDWLFSLIDDPNLRNSTASFSDVVGKVNLRIDDKNGLVMSAYHSRDNFKLDSDSLYRYFNSNAALQWRHSFSNQLRAVSSISYANYNYKLSSDQNPINAFELDYNIDHYAVKSEFDYFPKEKVNIKFGLSSILYRLKPGQQRRVGSASLVEEVELINEKGIETAIFGGYERELSDKLSVYGGLRLSIFNSLGPGRSFEFRPGSPKEVDFITDTTFHSNNELLKTYIGPEVRLSGRYKISDDLSLKLSYDRINQYIHVLSNTTSISPIDNWRLSSSEIKPQIGNQYSLGLYKTFFGTSLEMSLEGYYKRINNVLEYKDGAELNLNETLETDIIAAEGKSYGIEFLLKRNSGKFSGWLSYTYSRSLIRANGAFREERINSGEFFPSNFDRPHAIVLVSNYKINRRVNISLNVNYSSGRPITLPVGKFEINDQPLVLFTDRNQFRIPFYFRTDLAVNFEGNHRVKKKLHGSWSFSVYNLTGRANAFSVFFRSQDQQIEGFKLSVFKNAVPTVTYHFQLQ